VAGDNSGKKPRTSVRGVFILRELRAGFRAKIVSYAGIKLFSGRGKEVSWPVYLLSALSCGFYEVKISWEANMGVEKAGEKYLCSVCGNEVVVTKVGGGELVCCGKPMGKTEG